jgi:CoA:oxalate CoA-transferase
MRSAAVNPRIVTCSVTGFGEDGPNYQRPAFDQIVQGLGGGMSITGEGSGQHPVRAGIPIGDLGGGMFAVMGLQAALLERARSGRGQHVGVSMLDAQISAELHGDHAVLSGQRPDIRSATPTSCHVPYNTFRPPTISSSSRSSATLLGRRWSNCWTATCAPEVRGGSPGAWHKAFIEARIKDRLAGNTAEHWLARNSSACASLCSGEQSFQPGLVGPAGLHRNMVVEVAHPFGGSRRAVPGNPIKLSRGPASERLQPPPLLGAHTLEVFRSGLTRRRSSPNCRGASQRSDRLTDFRSAVMERRDQRGRSARRPAERSGARCLRRSACAGARRCLPPASGTSRCAAS